MTLLIATITPEAAWLTQDTFVSDATGAELPDGGTVTLADKVTAQGTGEAATAVPLAYGNKHQVVQAATGPGFVIGGAGSLALLLGFAHLQRLVTTEADIAIAAGMASATLRAMFKRLPAPIPTWVCMVGWSRAAGGPMGLLYASDQKFAEIRLNPGSHSVSPMLPPELVSEGLRARWAPAGEGRNTGGFHAQLGKAIHGAWSRGVFPNGAGMGIGGELVTVRAGSDGVTETRTPLAAPGAA